LSLLLDQLLSNLSHGQLPLDAACAQLEQILQQHPQQARQLIARVQTEILAGRLTHVAGRALLAALEGADSKTAVLSGERRAAVEPTRVRPAVETESTAIHSPGGTVRMGAGSADATLIRPAPALADDDDRTQHRVAPTIAATQRMPAAATPVSDPDATIRARRESSPDETQMRVRDDATVAKLAPAVDATLRLPEAAKTPAGTQVRPVSDEDATVQAQRIPAGTAARTLQAPTGESAYAPTLKTPEKTLVLDDRLVQSLDAGQVHHGPLQPGSIIKQRFVLETMIGKGGMGLVFGAIDRRKEEAKDPNPRVALKVLNADFQRHPQSFMALQREARKAQTLAHPNVVTVFDFDRDGDAVYMTMELLTGRPLEAIVREARGKGVSREIALPIIRGIAEGLAYAHRKGIVHSDLKPGNVYIADDGTPKILDFGIARAVPSSVTAENQDVFDAGSLGAYTEAYATDEMVDGIDPHPADDMYALGIIGYELLIGFHPYQRHSAPNSRKLGLKPPPLKGLKRREAQALERCLSLDRKDRPKDAGEFLKLFRGVTALQKATLAATAVLALVSGYLWYENYQETSPSRPFAELPLQTQQQFTELMKQGDEEWAFFQRENNPAALQSAVDRYAQAYALHPRNRDAVKALRRTADAFLKSAGDQSGQRKEIADYLQGQSDYYRKYAPVVDAAE
jgi:serine/threonine protein kinase